MSYSGASARSADGPGFPLQVLGASPSGLAPPGFPLQSLARLCPGAAPFPCLILALLVSNTAAAARDNPGDFFFAPLGEALMYSREGVSIGGGFIAGFGEGAALGIRLLYAQDAEQLAVLEAVFFLRFYLPRLEGAAGPFAQLNIGTALFGREKPPSFPAEAGIVSAGLALGWRFPLGSRWYIEPALRAGYPYIAGGGLSAGFRF